MIIEIKDLREIIDVLVNQIVESDIRKIQVDSDLYWKVLSSERENFQNEMPPELAVGSIVDDYEQLKKLINGNNLPTLVDIERLGDVLIAISESLSKSDKPFI